MGASAPTMIYIINGKYRISSANMDELIEISPEIYQTNSDIRENLRTILEITYERCNQIKNINNQVLAILAAVFLGVFTLAITFFTSTITTNDFLIIIGINALIATLLIWRYYSHIIDNELVSCYKRILYCEEKLDIPFEISLASWLEKNIEFELPPPKKNSVELLRKKKYFELDRTKKNLVIQRLIENNKCGYRFHNLWDKTTGYSILVLLVYQLYFLLINFNRFEYLFWTAAVYWPIAYDLALWGLTKDIKNNIVIQRDPTNEELEKIIDEVCNVER
jgi:hypothetical protein